MIIMRYCIYKHTCPNGKVYIGQTCKIPSKRWANGYGYKNQMFYKAVLKYGWDNIDHEILFSGLTKEEADQKEIELIAYYDSTNHDKGYNVAIGGFTTLGVPCSEETKEKISNAHKGMKRSEESKIKQSNALKGHVCSKETRRKIGEANSRRVWSEESKEKLRKANKGKIISEDTRRKMSESNKGRVPSKKNRETTAQNNRERIWTDEAREKISKANKGRPAPNKKKVVCVETDIVYDSAHQAADILSIARAGISRACNNNNRTAGGYHWRFFDAVESPRDGDFNENR